MAVEIFSETFVMPILSPPLAIIEEGLFGPSDETLLRLAAAPETVSAELRDSVLADPRYAELVAALGHAAPVAIAPTVESLPMPDWLAARIARRCRAQAAQFSADPRAGQIRAIERVIGPDGPLDFDLPRPLAVCLDRPYPGRTDLWSGWMVSPETDYAGYWDVLLEVDDEPFDPSAGMIQLWNPAYVFLPSAGTVLAELSPARLAAVRAAAAEFVAGDPPDLAPRPGFVAARETCGGHIVITGTPLGGDADPRWRYQVLYRAAQVALRAPVELALDAARERALRPGLLDRLRAGLERLGGSWAPGPALAHAMGRMDAKANFSFVPELVLRPTADGADAGTTLEGEIAGRVRLRAEAIDDGLVALLARLRGDAPLDIQVFCEGEITAVLRLNPDHPEDQVALDAALGYLLILCDPAGPEIARIDLPASGG